MRRNFYYLHFIVEHTEALADKWLIQGCASTKMWNQGLDPGTGCSSHTIQKSICGCQSCIIRAQEGHCIDVFPGFFMGP